MAATIKKIEAIIQPHKLDEVKQALTAIGVDAMTVTEVRGHGRQRGHAEFYRGQEYAVLLLPKMKVETVVVAEDVEDVLRAICESARTGKFGDGKIFVTDIEDALRIRNGNCGVAAL